MKVTSCGHEKSSNLHSVTSFWFSALQVSSPLSDEAVVCAVLFYSVNCEHYYHVITEVLPPLFEQYGDLL
jgi:hypothetical protein